MNHEKTLLGTFVWAKAPFRLLQVLLFCFPALARGENLFANDGRFAPGMEVPLVQSGAPANCMTGLV